MMDYYSIVPQGLYYGIGMMKTGEEYCFYMPSWLAYSQYSTESFDSYSNFIIDVKVLSHTDKSELNNKEIDSIKNYVAHTDRDFEQTDDGLFYHEIEEGTGSTPVENSTVTFNFTRRYLDSTIIASTMGGDPVTVTLNKGEAVKGLEEGLLKMKEGGKALLIMPFNIGFKQSVCVVPESIQQNLFDKGFVFTSVLPFSIIMYDVELVKVE